MKILSISSGYPDKNYRVKKIFAHEQNLEFKKQGCHIDVINLGADRNQIEIYEGITVYKYLKAGNNLFKIYKIINKLKKQINNKDYDLVLFNGLATNQYFYLKYIKNISKKVAVIVHGTDGMIDKSSLKNYIRRKFLKQVDYIFPVSNYTDTLVAYLERRTNKSASKSKVIYNGINVDKFLSVIALSKENIRNEFHINKNVFVILTVCDLIERKGVDILIDAIANFSKKNKDFLHIIIGRGDQEKTLKTKVKTFGLQNNIQFIDYIAKDNDLVKYYKLADVYCMLSKTIYDVPACEGFGISYIEASYLGLPVIGGNNGGPTSAIQHNFTGYLVDPYSKDCHLDVSNYLSILKNDKKEYIRLSNNGQIAVNKEFTWTKNVSKILKIIK